jgi:hypothetical protein
MGGEIGGKEGNAFPLFFDDFPYSFLATPFTERRAGPEREEESG